LNVSDGLFGSPRRLEKVTDAGERIVESKNRVRSKPANAGDTPFPRPTAKMSTLA
jgi:hypothetical protein